MARKKKHQNSQGFSTDSGAFVPATLENSHSHNSLSFSSPSSTGDVSGSPMESGSFAQYSRNLADYSNRKQKRSRGAKAALAIIIVALIAGISALGFYVFKESQKQAINQDLHSMSKEVMESIDKELTGMTKFDEPFTLLLLGSDARADDPDMGARTDTIILCRIDPTQNIISMVSIPRDTKIEVEGAGTQKFNAAYTYGGPSGTIAAVKKLCGVDIDHYAEINFEGLVGLVDAIGGIEVYVDEAIEDPDAGDVGIPQGLNHLDGEGALVFSRSRAYADGDFTRVSNQRKVIEAILHKGLEAPAPELYGLIEASTAFLTTDSAMDVDFIFSLADQIRHNNEYAVQVYSATIPATTSTIDGVSYVLADEAGVADMMEVFLAGGDVGAGSAEADEAAAADAELADELAEVDGVSGRESSSTSVIN